jgi:ribosomal protein L18E
MLSLTEGHKVRIQDAGGELLYLFSVPGKVVGGAAVSDKEVTITFEL